MTTPGALCVTVLGSGSRGNAILVEAGDTRVLVDVGFGPRSLAKRLAAIECAPESIAAVVLTHEHVDHAQGALPACARWGWPMYATIGTLASLPSPLLPVRPIAHGASWSIGELRGDSMSVPHDAADCAAIRFEHQPSGARIGIALDLGHVPSGLPAFFERLDLLVVEANHDLDLLLAGPYPWPLKQRIRGERGHLDNRATAALVADCAHPGLCGVVLAHLSETNNTPATAVDSVTSALRTRGTQSGATRAGLVAASQRVPVGPIGVGERFRARTVVPRQFELSL